MIPVPLIGHGILREQLVSRMGAGALPASILLHGPRGVGKQRLALWLGATRLCPDGAQGPCGACQHCRLALNWQHPDLHWVFPRPRLKDADADLKDIVGDLNEGIDDRRKADGLYAPPSGTEGIFVSTVRAILQLAAPSPAMARHRVFVIGDAERMVAQEGADQAANAFLKLLEEPPADTTIILTSSEPGALLPTIRSRVVAIRVAPLPDHEVRAFLRLDPVQRALAKETGGLHEDRVVAAAAGAPGSLIGAGSKREARAAAEFLLESARGDRAALLRAAFVQKASGARGAFSDVLDAVNELLAERLRDTVTVRPGAALATTKAIFAVEKAKDMADGNANPMLVTAALLGDLQEAFA